MTLPKWAQPITNPEEKHASAAGVTNLPPRPEDIAFITLFWGGISEEDERFFFF